MDRVTRITMTRDSKHAQVAKPASVSPTALCNLQVETDALAIDQDRA